MNLKISQVIYSPSIRSGEVMQAISKTLIGISGKLYGTLICCRKMRHNKSFQRTVKKLRFLPPNELQRWASYSARIVT